MTLRRQNETEHLYNRNDTHQHLTLRQRPLNHRLMNVREQKLNNTSENGDKFKNLAFDWSIWRLVSVSTNHVLDRHVTRLLSCALESVGVW
jgi:hypothetical protein